MSVTSKFEAGPDEVNLAARSAFMSTYKDLETLLEMNGESRMCHDLPWAASNSRNQLSKRYHTNFNFFLSCDNQELGAMGALRRLGRYHYPCPEDVHSILFRIIAVNCRLFFFSLLGQDFLYQTTFILQNTKDRLALYRAQEFFYNMVSLHPPCSPTMRNFYWSVMSSRYDVTFPTSFEILNHRLRILL